jgi:hypothetical protein
MDSAIFSAAILTYDSSDSRNYNIPEKPHIPPSFPRPTFSAQFAHVPFYHIVLNNNQSSPKVIRGRIFHPLFSPLKGKEEILKWLHSALLLWNKSKNFEIKLKLLN